LFEGKDVGAQTSEGKVETASDEDDDSRPKFDLEELRDELLNETVYDEL
jgi:hypothetical protein